MTEPEYTITRMQIDAVLFDLDGVVTRTAAVHAVAWKTLFDRYLDARSLLEGEDASPSIRIATTVATSTANPARWASKTF